MWREAATDKAAISNKKLQVKHTVDTASLSTTTNNSSGGYGSVSAASDRIREGLSNSTGPGSEGLMPEQQFKDNANLRKKYDELVAFSVNLTAERDILNNALEQAKRDLNREMAARMSAEDSAVQAPSRSSTRSKSASDAEETKKAKSGFSFFQLLVIATVMFFVGRYVGAEGVIKAVTKGQDL
jgi:ribose 1,5-bisphosphokinase PhnN